MTKYLLTCHCGANVPVEIGQAGERVVCQCGATLEAPPLRKMRHLPVAPAAGASAGLSPAWSPRKGIVTACLVLAAVLAVMALWSWITEPVIAPFSAAGRQQAVEEGLKTMTPEQSWHLWVERYKPLAEQGFTEFEHPHAAAIEQQIAKQRFFQRMLLAAAGVFVAVAALAAFWPRARTRRQGEA